MINQLERERQMRSSKRDSSGLPIIENNRYRALSPVLRFLSRSFAFLGYAIGIFILVAGFLEFAAWAIWSVHPFTRQAELENQIGSPVYAGAEWAREFWQEESLRRKKPTIYVPFRVWSVTDWHGKYINNDPGVGGVWRRTLNPTNCDPVHQTIAWTFGGSTMYGTAIPDWATIPSYLSRDLNTVSGNCVVVSNFGVEGYVTDQELILLGEQLKAGGHPDIVIFYDGVNDSSLAWAPSGSPNAHFVYGTVKSRIEGSLSGRLDFLQKSYALRLVREIMAHLRPASSIGPQIANQQANIASKFNNYAANLQLARALSVAYKFKLYCFWQPTLVYGHKPLVPFEQRMADRDVSGTSTDSAWFLTMISVYREADRYAAGHGSFVFLGNLFDSVREPLYVDEAHLGPRGNELVAQAIANYVHDHPEGSKARDVKRQDRSEGRT
jgi:lysophospholipase L1-like esterase